MTKKLFEPTPLGNRTLRNHMVMSPMTRNRAIDSIPNDLMATYYSQRAEAGLIITEGTAPSANGLGYARIPGIFTPMQVAGWKGVTGAVHEKGGTIFLQLMHCGRIAHPLNMPPEARIVAPSAVQPKGEMWTDQKQKQPYPVPQEMTLQDIQKAVAEYVQAAKNALEAGFDGVELHGANGYLIEQFLAPNTNLRTDEYGGSEEKRTRFMVEVVTQVAAAIGKEKVGIRLSPEGVFNDIEPYSETQLAYMTQKLQEAGILYIHLVNHSSMGAPEVPFSRVKTIRDTFTGNLILSGGYTTAEAAEADLQSGLAQLIAFGRTFLANPDLVERLKTGAELNPPDPNTFYSAGPEGYTDYPILAEKAAM